MKLRLAVVVLSFMLILAPANVWLRGLLLTPLWAASLVAFLAQPTVSFASPASASGGDRSRSILLALFAVCFGVLLVAIGRGILANSLSVSEGIEQLLIWTSVAVFLAGWLRPQMSLRDARALVAASVVGIGLVVVANVVLRAAGVLNPTLKEQTAGVPATLLGLIGYKADRAAFPLGSGLSAVGSFAGAGFVAASVLIVRWRLRLATRIAMALVLVLCAYVILAVDSRSTVVLAPVCALACLVLPTRLLRRSHWLVPALPALPLLVVSGSLLLAQTASVANLSRSAGDIESVGKRLFVWTAIAGEYSTFRPLHLIGFGLFGQTSSGIVNRYQSIVAAGYQEERLTAHNAVMQWMLDTGYLGGLLFLVVTWLTLRMAARHLQHGDPALGRVLVGVLVYLGLTGITQAVPTPYIRETLLLFLCLGAAAAASADSGVPAGLSTP